MKRIHMRCACTRVFPNTREEYYTWTEQRTLCMPIIRLWRMRQLLLVRSLSPTRLLQSHRTNNKSVQILDLHTPSTPQAPHLALAPCCCVPRPLELQAVQHCEETMRCPRCSAAWNARKCQSKVLWSQTQLQSHKRSPPKNNKRKRNISM